MKVVLILFLVLLYSCSGVSTVNKNIIVSEEELYQTVHKLTSTPEPRNYFNINSLNLSASYIDSVFKSHSKRVKIECFSVDGEEYKNIICSFGPENTERIIVGAHYDVCAEQPGADDNASGIAGLLELARLLDLYSPKLENQIDLVAFSLEEPPFFRTENMGSAVYAKKLYDSETDIKLMICLEMIGYFDESPESQKYPVSFLSWFYPDVGNFIAIVANFKSGSYGSDIKKIMSENSNIAVEQLTAPSIIKGVDFSDHLNFWKYGYKAVMITDTAFMRNPNYHQETDTIDTLNFKKMAEVIKGLYFALIQI